MILVTGSAGKTGRAVIQALDAFGAKVRALVRRADQIQMVESMGAHDVVVGDMRTQSSMEQAVQGVGAIYHICPNVNPEEVSIGQIVIATAQKAGVAHFVFHSVLKPQTEAMPHHWNKLRVEERLIESGLPYTILQPAAYMQNILVHWESIINEGVLPVPYPADTRLSLVDLLDVAQAAATVLTEPGHHFATYELVSVAGLSQTEVTGILSQELGRPVQVSVIPLETWQEQARGTEMGDYQVETLVSMFRYYRRFEFLGNPQVLGWLLNRPPNSFSAFVKRTIRERIHQESK